MQKQAEKPCLPTTKCDATKNKTYHKLLILLALQQRQHYPQKTLSVDFIYSYKTLFHSLLCINSSVDFF